MIFIYYQANGNIYLTSEPCTVKFTSGPLDHCQRFDCFIPTES